jgi:membrane protein DedA with SNARE-associated domain
MQAAVSLAEQSGQGAAALLALLQEWREPLLFAILALECVPVIGFVAPGLIALVLAGYASAGLPAGEALRLAAAAFAGVFLADTVCFAAGRAAGERSLWIARLAGPRAPLGEELGAQPAAVLLFYQFPPYSRMFAPLFLGSAAFEWRRWLSLSAAATAAFVGAFFALGFAAARISTAATGAASLAGAVSLVFALLFGGWAVRIAVRLWRRRGTA